MKLTSFLDQLRHAELVSASIVRNIRPYDWKAKAGRQINPLRITPFNQINLPLSVPIFQFFLSQYRRLHGFKHFITHQMMHRIFFGKTVHNIIAVLIYSAHQIRGYANINRTIMPVGQYIDARLLFHKFEYAAKWMLKQVQHDHRVQHNGWVHDEDRVKDEDWEEHDGLIQYENNDAGEDTILSYEKARLDAA